MSLSDKVKAHEILKVRCSCLKGLLSSYLPHLSYVHGIKSQEFS